MTALPLSTYRLQFNSQFTFRHAMELVPYLDALGITHCYASPLLQAKPGSPHGYDIIDPSRINSELGTQEEFEQFVKLLKSKGMGLILDIVPNHMYVYDVANSWWKDVLENGPSSPYAEYFDIDWNPPRQELVNKVLLPLLDEQYGISVESQMIQVCYKDGAFNILIPNLSLPTDPCSWNVILEPAAKSALDSLGAKEPRVLELQSIITAISHLPATIERNKEKVAERLREKEVIKRRLATLVDELSVLQKIIQETCTLINGEKGVSQSFDTLESFLQKQPYHLCLWRVANDEINYRRFFDQSALAGIHTEKREVFEATHAFILQLVEKKLVDGLRVDHLDGLWNPEQYLVDLQADCASKVASQNDDSLFYVIGEKILTGNEKLSQEWLLSGTVGYDFLNQVNGLFVFQQNRKELQEIYYSFTEILPRVSEHVYIAKKLILATSMSSELFVLARYLDHISQQHRSSRDFTQESLRLALRDTCACFPVYRSYIDGPNGIIHDEDRVYISTAITRAKRLNPAISSSIFDFLADVLLLNHPEGLTEAQKMERAHFVMRFQQITSPVMAKGVEDTAFYRYYPLSSLNEVGGDFYAFGTSVDSFHDKNSERLKNWPRTFLTTSTHDTKRSEDVRARINVLSEIPDVWHETLLGWALINQQHKSKEGDEACPDNNEEYLLYQTLIGAWPLHPVDPAQHLKFLNRISAYMEKALKEAKVNTSWINPNLSYDEKVKKFIQDILAIDYNPFLKDFKEFMPKICKAGMLNSLNQLLLKVASPGVADFYQGNETWDFSLVDPDNRRPVDFESRKFLLESMDDLEQMMHSPEDGRIKLYVTQVALQARKRNPDCFIYGNYIPLKVTGEKSTHVIAFARLFGDKAYIVIATRFFMQLIVNSSLTIPADVWKDTQIALPKEMSGYKFRELFTGSQMDTLDLEKVLHTVPFALLESMNLSQ